LVRTAIVTLLDLPGSTPVTTTRTVLSSRCECRQVDRDAAPLGRVRTGSSWTTARLVAGGFGPRREEMRDADRDAGDPGRIGGGKRHVDEAIDV
jgi:hypothetical protein